MSIKSNNQTNEWHQAVYNLYPATCSIDEQGNGFDTNNNPIVVDEAAVNAETERLDAIVASNSHRRPRYKAYPTMQDQMDMMWHDKKNDTTTWEDAVQAVKDANPKP